VNELSQSAVAQPAPSLADRKIRVLTRRDPLAVRPGTSLAECLRAIQRTGVGDSVLVLDDERHLLGVLTERDIFGRLIETGADLEQPVESMMNTQPKRLSLDSTVRDAISLMETGRYRNVPLVDDDGVVVGIIRQQDILRYFAEAFPEELLNLPPRPHQRMKEAEGA
jgi:signal-transduction protein with cAMP-binding, CBS, and nucleotidyltransferase domain